MIQNQNQFADGQPPPEARREARVLETLAFLDDRSNVVLTSTLGVGNTALSVAIGTRACEGDRTVAFANIPNLVIETKKAFEKFDLVILNDLGYCSFNRECSKAPLSLLSGRNEKGSMVITTNLPFDRRTEAFGDSVLTGAIVDHIEHKAHVVDMTSENYRVIEAKERVRKANSLMG